MSVSITYYIFGTKELLSQVKDEMIVLFKYI